MAHTTGGRDEERLLHGAVGVAPWVVIRGSLDDTDQESNFRFIKAIQGLIEIESAAARKTVDRRASLHGALLIFEKQGFKHGLTSPFCIDLKKKGCQI